MNIFFALIVYASLDIIIIQKKFSFFRKYAIIMSIDQFILHEGYTVYGYNDMRLRLKLVRKDETKEKNETLNINFYNNVSWK